MVNAWQLLRLLCRRASALEDQVYAGSGCRLRPASGLTMAPGVHRRLRFGTIICRAGLPAQIQGTVDHANVGIRLREIPEHAVRDRVELLGEQTHIVGMGE